MVLDIIRKLIENKKINQSQIAEIAGVKQPTISRWLNEETNLKTEPYLKIQKYLKDNNLIDEPQPTETTSITNSTFNNSVAINKGSITINGYTEKKEAENKFSLLSEEDQKLALAFVEFLHNYELKG